MPGHFLVEFLFPLAELIYKGLAMRLRPLDPRMVKQPVDGGSLGGLFFKAPVYEVTEFFAPLLGLELGCRVIRYVEEDSDLLFINVGGFADRQLNKENAIGPDVHLRVVAVLTKDHFGCHPADRPDLTISHFLPRL